MRRAVDHGPGRLARRLTAGALLVAAALVAAGCATTTQSAAPAEPAWRRAGAAPAAPGPAPAAPAAPDRRLAVYVASFGLAPSVAASHPELASAQVGLGIGNRIADALYDTGRFRFLEEKAELAERIAGLLARGAGAEADEPSAASAAADSGAAPAEAAWLLYGEVVAVDVARRERVSGVVGRSEVETRVGVQIRLVERASRRFVPATATGVDVARGGARPGRADELDPAAVAAATAAAVRQAAAELAAKLGPP